MKSNEQILTEYMRQNYSDQKLAELLAFAEDGKLSYSSCCCFVGVPTANHSLMSMADAASASDCDHYQSAIAIPEAPVAERAFRTLAVDSADGSSEERDAERRARLIPLIYAEIKRRDDLKSESPQVIENQILIGPRFSMIG